MAVLTTKTTSIYRPSQYVHRHKSHHWQITSCITHILQKMNYPIILFFANALSFFSPFESVLAVPGSSKHSTSCLEWESPVLSNHLWALQFCPFPLSTVTFTYVFSSFTAVTKEEIESIEGHHVQHASSSPIQLSRDLLDDLHSHPSKPRKLQVFALLKCTSTKTKTRRRKVRHAL